MRDVARLPGGDILFARMGRFIAVANVLGRLQSMISRSFAGLEVQPGLGHFECTARLPLPADEGCEPAVMLRADESESCSCSPAAGTEAELSIAIDAVFPVRLLTHALHAFRAAFPRVKLQVRVGTASAVAERVLAGDSRIGVIAPLSDPIDELVIPRSLQ